MSEEQSANAEASATNVEEQNQTVTSPDPQGSLPPEQMAVELERLRASNERILQESKEYKGKWQQMRKEQEQREQATLEEQGRYKEMYQTLEGKHTELLKNVVHERVGNCRSGSCESRMSRH